MAKITGNEGLNNLRVVAEGKTKIIYESPEDRDVVIISSKDDITAGDGAKHDVIPNKGTLATQTTSNVFECLSVHEIPTSFLGRTGSKEFEAIKCEMIPLEVVIRRSAYGSFLKRNPEHIEKERFEKPLVEIYLKTDSKNWRGTEIPNDDPFIKVEGDEFKLFNPGKPINDQESFLSVNKYDVIPQKINLEEIYKIAEKVFIVLENEWAGVDCELIDMKIEFGITPNGGLVVSDVIDNDSWRLMVDNEHLDKQVYRDGGELSDVAKRYQVVANLSESLKRD